MVVVFRNVMIQNVTGAIDAAFLRASLAGHHAALAHDPTGYAVITMVEPSAKVPPGPVRDESARNRMRGIVTRVLSDTVMAQVELQCGPFRVVSLMSREAVDALGLEVGAVAIASVKATNVIVGIPQ